MKIYFSGVPSIEGADPFKLGFNIMLTAFDLIGSRRSNQRRLLEILELRESGAVTPEHFLDSGAYSLWQRSIKNKRMGGVGSQLFYETKEFKSYVDEYALLVHQHKKAIDLYANVDVIGNAEVTYEIQKRLEHEFGIRPIPVFHAGGDLKYLYKYMDGGYDVIGLGNVAKISRNSRYFWFDKFFNVICDSKTKLPRIKAHGFGIGATNYLFRYPFWSVDTTRWIVDAVRGIILVPRKRNNKFVFDGSFKCYKVSVEPCHRSPSYNRSVLKLQDFIGEWLTYLGLPLGEEWNDKVMGRVLRLRANMLFYQKICSVVPDWPWAFEKKSPSFELTF